MTSRQTLATLLCLGLLGICQTGVTQTPPPKDRAAVIRMLPDLHLLEPIWSGDAVYRESATLLQPKDGEPAAARLAFEVEELISVKAGGGERVLVAGRDFQLSDNKHSLLVSAETKLPFIKESDLFPPTGAPNSYKHRVGKPEQSLLFGPGHWFHDRQIEVSYRHKPAKWSGAVPRLAQKLLPKTFALLRAGKPLTLGVSGDSISAGGDASGVANVPPFMPAYPELVAAQLQAGYGGEISLKNRAVGGWSIANGVGDLDKLLAEKPQLIVMAYGMNDVGRRDPEWFKGQAKTFIDRVRAADPNIELILVAPMLGHSEWVHTPREMFFKYRDVLAAFEGPGIALADVSSVWETLLKSKHDLDLTGNGLNHPNDFGHRLYAQTILGLLTPAAKP
ncbi:MAG: GDSL-like Lipase/Acylhydrolase [Planctomycetaceae bacterium]|nr:GDSL-like Lipase/Acylhydrolase [Planctomycetaceae bacterium]